MLKRIAFFTYGTVAYLIFLGTFLYAIGFIGNIAVPTRLDGPAAGSWLAALVTDALLLTVFAVQHSVMARKWFKDRWTRVVPRPIERSSYVLFSSLALILMFALWQPPGGTVWAVDNAIGRDALYAFFTFGWLLVLMATFLIDHFDLFGMRQVWLFLLGKPYTPHEFVTPGPYRIVRHPLYLGWLFTFWMTPTMTVSHLVFAIATSLYILAAIQFEEHDLVREHGIAYENYRRRVPMLLPLLFRRRNAQTPPLASSRTTARI